MGRGQRAGKKTKQPHTIVRSVFSTVDRDVKRKQLDVIASICGTDRNSIGKMITDVALTDGYENNENNNDERTEHERASSSGRRRRGKATAADEQPANRNTPTTPPPPATEVKTSQLQTSLRLCQGSNSELPLPK